MGQDMFASLVGGINDSVAATYGAKPKPESEEVKRDAALDTLELSRAELIADAKVHAVRIATETGTVTSTQVLASMRASGHGDDLDRYDRRWMGAVFRRGTGWKRVGWSSTGSHCRPVAVWAVA